MKATQKLSVLVCAGGVMLSAAVLLAKTNRFSEYSPMAASVGITATEATPITFGSPDFQQKSIANRAELLAGGSPNSGAWDMNTLNETGPHRGRYLFTVFETDRSGVQRHDLLTGQTDTIWYSPASYPSPDAHKSFDPSFWTPWGTLITGEERWCNAVAGCGTPTADSAYGRLFEFRNPIDAPAIKEPLVGNFNSGADFVHQNVIPRTSHEGIQFDKALNMYFVDELNGGTLFKYTPAASWGEIMSGRKGYFDAGQTFVLRVGLGTVPNATGAYTWVAITTTTGAALPEALTITDVNGVVSVDGRNTVNLAAFKGTDYQRPEDLQIQTIAGREYLYMTTTTTNEVYRLDLGKNMISVFANQATRNLATGSPVGGALANVDNLAIDNDGNIYIVEDFDGGQGDDIWFANDLNNDGDLTDPGEGLGRWASNGTDGSEFTGLYFDPWDHRRAWVNIQHPDSGDDRTIEITIPVR